jgi:excisionase family DNA binding protein
MNEIPRLFTPAEAAKLMGISRSQVYILMNRGQLKSVHIGRSRRIARGHIDSFIEELNHAS